MQSFVFPQLLRLLEFKSSGQSYTKTVEPIWNQDRDLTLPFFNYS